MNDVDKKTICFSYIFLKVNYIRDFEAFVKSFELHAQIVSTKFKFDITVYDLKSLQMFKL